MLFLLWAALAARVPLAAQEDASRRVTGMQAADTTKTASIAFDKSLNTYHWTGLSLYTGLFGPLGIHWNEQYLSTVIRTDRILITDNQSLDLHVRDAITENVAAALRVTSFLNADNRSLGLGNASSHGFYGGASLSPVAGLLIEPLAGYRVDRQLDRTDRGLAFLLDSLHYAAPGTQFDGTYEYDRLDPRRLESGNAAFSLASLFSAGSRNLLALTFYRNRRDFYSAADPGIRTMFGVDDNIETRSDNWLAASDTLDYGLMSGMLLTLSGNILTREINRVMRYEDFGNSRISPPGTSIDELRMEGSARLRARAGKGLSGEVLLAYLERDEKHALLDDEIRFRTDAPTLAELEERKNNHARQTTLAAVVEASPSARDTVVVSGSGSILHYDTPSGRNDDDRDELRWLANVSASHAFNRHLRLSVVVDAGLTHLVYLFASQSANNTWNRTLRLTPRFDYTPWPALTSANTFDVVANYTVYDFAGASALTQSFSFRQFTFRDSTAWGLTRRLGLEWLSDLRLYERGELDWNAFTERPVNDFEEATILAGVRYAMTERLLFSLGIRYFSQLRFGYAENVRTLENRLHSMGPTARLWMSVGARTELSFKGWYERQTQTGQPNRGFTTMALLLNVRI